MLTLSARKLTTALSAAVELRRGTGTTAQDRSAAALSNPTIAVLHLIRPLLRQRPPSTTYAHTRHTLRSAPHQYHGHGRSNPTCDAATQQQQPRCYRRRSSSTSTSRIWKGEPGPVQTHHNRVRHGRRLRHINHRDQPCQHQTPTGTPL
jgi:hypothetical protein